MPVVSVNEQSLDGDCQNNRPVDMIFLPRGVAAMTVPTPIILEKRALTVFDHLRQNERVALPSSGWWHTRKGNGFISITVDCVPSVAGTRAHVSHMPVE